MAGRFIIWTLCRLLMMTALCALILICGCGGSGGGSSLSKTRTSSISISWPARPPTIKSPASALSAVIILEDATNSGVEISLLANRKGNGAYTEQYFFPTQIKPAVYTMTAHFDAQPGGMGGEVATASATVLVSSVGQLLQANGSPLGSISFTSNLASVSIVAGQIATIGQPYSIKVAATDLRQNPIAVSTGSAHFTLAQSPGAIITSTGQLLINSIYGAIVQATVDGVSSPQTAVNVQPPYVALRSLNTQTNSLRLNPVTGTIWASGSSTDSTYSNQLVEINPTAALVVSSVNINGEAGPLAVSDDGSTIFTGMNGASSIKVVDTSHKVLKSTFSLSNPSIGNDPPATSIEVAPGTSNTIAVARTPDSGLGPELYINGLQAPDTLGLYEGNSMAFLSPGELFSFQGWSTSFQLSSVRVSGQGLKILGYSDGEIQGFGATILYRMGLIFGSDGSVISPGNQIKLGQFDLVRARGKHRV